MVLNHIWHVELAQRDAVGEVTLSHWRQLPNGDLVDLDGDPEVRLDLEGGEDAELVMDGLLAVLPDGEQLSCAVWESRSHFLIFESEGYRYIDADRDKAKVRAAFADGALKNSDGLPDFIFVGGSPESHTEEVVIRTASRIGKLRLGGPREAAADELLSTYTVVAMTSVSLIHVLRRIEPGEDFAASVRAALNKAAAPHGFEVPALR